MSNPARIGGFLIAAGFAVYLATGIAGWYDTSQFSFYASILGTVLVWLGVSRIAAGMPERKLVTGIATAALVGAFLLGRAANQMTVETTDALRTSITLTAVQSSLFTVAGGVALCWRSSALVRILSVVALAGNAVYGYLLLGAFDSLLAGTTTFEQMQSTFAPVTVVDNLLLVAALVFALRQTPDGRPGGMPTPAFVEPRPMVSMTQKPADKAAAPTQTATTPRPPTPPTQPRP